MANRRKHSRVNSFDSNEKFEVRGIMELNLNVALILAGGVGRRMNMGDFPKQYLMVNEHPIIDYCLCKFQEHSMIDDIVIVADELWWDFIDEWLQKSKISKFVGYAKPGETRQLSIYNGLLAIESHVPNVQNVIIHDAVRPLLSAELITECFNGLSEADGVMPVLPMKDTCYQSLDGREIDGFFPRNQLFAGQAPEAFHFVSYLGLHQKLSKQYLMEISGSSELAFKNGLKVKMIPGEERNFKITTQDDLRLFENNLLVSKKVK